MDMMGVVDNKGRLGGWQPSSWFITSYRVQFVGRFQTGTYLAPEVQNYNIDLYLAFGPEN